MIGAVIFVIFFVLFLAVTLEMPTLPPGDMIHDLLAIPKVDYPILGIPAWLLIAAIINGVVYGFIIWLIYSVISHATRSRKKERQPYTSPPTAQQQQRSLPPIMPPTQHTPPPTTPPPRHTPPPQITPAQQIQPQIPTQVPPQTPTPRPAPTLAGPAPRYKPPPQHAPPPSAPPAQDIQQPTPQQQYTPPPPVSVPAPAPQPTQAPAQPPGATASPAELASKEEFTVSSENLVDRVKELLHEGNVTRIVVKDEKGKVLFDMPASLGVAGTIAAPWLAGLGAIAALATKCTISVVRKE